MKKNLEKIFTSASIVVAVILIMVLLVTTFGGIKAEEFNSELVRGLLITLAILYVVLAVAALTLMFINSDVVKEVVVRTEKGGSVRVSSAVITKIVKKACAGMEGVKCKKVVLVQDDYGVRLKTSIKIVDKDVIEVETYLRLLLEDMFLGEFGFKFASIEIKVMVLTPKYKPDSDAIGALAAEKVAEIKAEQEELEAQEQAAEAAVEQAEEAELASDTQVDVAEEETVKEAVEEAQEQDVQVETEAEPEAEEDKIEE